MLTFSVVPPRSVRSRRLLAALVVAACGWFGVDDVLRAAGTLDIYFIDVEGGQSTLVITPSGESLLVDTGFPADGTFQSVADEVSGGRDAARIAAVARAAGLTRIDYLLITHFHADHDGGVVELAKLMPIGTFVDHGRPLPEVESVAGSLRAFEAYERVRATGRHLQPAAGDRLPLKDVEAVIVSAAGATITRPLAGSGARPAACRTAGLPPDEKNENPRSTGFHLRFGRFRFLDLGDLSGDPLRALACPASLVGPVQVYLVSHHGGTDAADPAVFEAFAPRVAVVNNGERKGGVASTFAMMKTVPGMDVWQLHRRPDAGAANATDARIANLDETTAHWIKVSANQDGSFEVTNGRTGQTLRYR